MVLVVGGVCWGCDGVWGWGWVGWYGLGVGGGVGGVGVSKIALID